MSLMKVKTSYVPKEFQHLVTVNKEYEFSPLGRKTGKVTMDDGLERIIVLDNSVFAGGPWEIILTDSDEPVDMKLT